MLALAVVVTAAAAGQDVASKRKPPRQADGPVLVVRTPQPESFELALDEVDIEGDTAPRAVPSTSVMAMADGRATLRVTRAASAQDLLKVGAALEAANPGSRVSWVLYSPELPRTPETRVQLTREVGLLLDDTAPPEAVVADLGTPRAVPGVPNGFIVEAGSPQSALDLVETLRVRPGVRAAYSLVKRPQSPR